MDNLASSSLIERKSDERASVSAKKQKYKKTRNTRASSRSKKHYLMQTETQTVNKGFMCEVCGKVFAVKYSVARHFNSVHLKKRMYCPFCKKGFKQKSHLKKHMLQSCKMKSDDFV